jgi:cytochrome b reductase 1
MPIHVYSGLLLFGTVIATVLMGVTEKLFFVL